MKARATDPMSSHFAGDLIEASGTAAKQRVYALYAVKKHPRLTSKELALLTGLDRYMLARRLPEIEELKQGSDRKMRTCKLSGKISVIWELK